MVLLGTLLSGATLYLSPRFDPVAALAALERDRLTIVLGVPAMFALWVITQEQRNVRSIEIPESSNHFLLRRTVTTRGEISGREPVRNDATQRVRGDGMLADNCAGESR